MPSLIPLNDTLGASFIGVVFSSVVFGITCLQAYMYYTQHCGRDNLRLKIMVGSLLALDTLHLAFICVFMYHYTVTNFGDYKVLLFAHWSVLVQVPLAHLLSVIIQLFFAWRIYHISKKRLWIPCAIFAFSIAQLPCSIMYAIRAFQLKLFTNAGQIEAWSTSALSLNAACDVLIAGSMMFYLRRSKTLFSRTNQVITRLITYALNTCLLTTVCGIACLITYIVAASDSLAFIPFFFMLPRVYTCSFISTLNTRGNIRQDLIPSSGLITLSHLGDSRTLAHSSDNSQGAMHRSDAAWSDDMRLGHSDYSGVMDIDGVKKAGGTV